MEESEESLDPYMMDKYQIMLVLEQRRLEERKRLGYQVRFRGVWVVALAEICETCVGQMVVAYRAMEYLERYLIHKENARAARSSRSDWLSLGACLYIASKVETWDHYMRADSIVELLHDTKKDDLIREERNILTALGFELESATTIEFLYLYCNWLELDIGLRMRASDLCQITMCHWAFRLYLPSLVAISCIHLSVRMTPLVGPLQKFCKIFEPFHKEQLEECILLIRKIKDTRPD